MLTILDWPDRRLNPNARIHRMQKAKIAHACREKAVIDTCAQVPWEFRKALADRDGIIHLTITFRPPDRRRRDLDNMLASCKSTLDGFADALGVDDNRFELTLRRGDTYKLGRVEIVIG